MSNDGGIIEVGLPNNSKESSQNFQSKLDTYDKKIDLAYEQELIKSKDKGETPTTIGWEKMQDTTSDNDRIIRMAQLMEKYTEYGRRLSNENPMGIFPPDPRDRHNLDSLYKREVAKQIILKGSVNTQALNRAIEKTNGQLDLYAYLNACGVIESYVRDGGTTGIIGGTGLRQPIKK